MHLLVAIDTTHIQAEHRIRMYVNGDSLIEHGLDTESMPGDRNLDLQFNDKLGMEVIPVDLRDAYAFGGGLHCCTADVYRESEFKDYFPKQ